MEVEIAPMAPDGGWGWIALSATFVIGTFLAGYLKSVGVLMVEWQIEFDVGAQEVSWIGVALGFITCTGGVLGSSLSGYFGSRIIVVVGCALMSTTLLLGSFTTELWQLYVTNFFTGLGISLGYLPALLAVGFYFDKKMGLANGIGFAGSGFGLIVVPPILQLLVDYFGWRTTLRILAGSSLLACLCGLLLKPTKKEKYFMIKEKKKRKKISQETNRGMGQEVVIPDDITMDRSGGKGICKRVQTVFSSCFKSSGFHLLFGNKLYLFIITTFLWTSFGSFGSTIYFNARAVFDVGLTQLEASYLISAIGVGNLIGRVVHGYFLDRNLISPSGMYALFAMISAVAIFCNPFLNNFWTLMMCAVVFGLTNGPYGSLQVMVLREMLPPGDVSAGFAVGMFFNGFAMVIGLFIMSYLFDSSGDYDLSFHVAGVSLFVSGLLVLLLMVYKKLKRGPDMEPIPSEDPKEAEDGAEKEAEPMSVRVESSQQSTEQDVTSPSKISHETSL